MRGLWPTTDGYIWEGDPDQLPETTLVKMCSSDGNWVINPQLACLGKKYRYDPASRRFARAKNLKTGDEFDTELIYTWEDSSMSLMPTELLDV
jgi:hypothetical protein